MEMKYGLVKSFRISATWTFLAPDELDDVPLDALPPELQAARLRPATAPRTAS